jgi:hypothetical protein
MTSSNVLTLDNSSYIYVAFICLNNDLTSWIISWMSPKSYVTLILDNLCSSDSIYLDFLDEIIWLGDDIDFLWISFGLVPKLDGCFYFFSFIF